MNKYGPYELPKISSLKELVELRNNDDPEPRNRTSHTACRPGPVRRMLCRRHLDGEALQGTASADEQAFRKDDAVLPAASYALFHPAGSFGLRLSQNEPGSILRHGRLPSGSY